MLFQYPDTAEHCRVNLVAIWRLYLLRYTESTADTVTMFRGVRQNDGAIKGTRFHSTVGVKTIRVDRQERFDGQQNRFDAHRAIKTFAFRPPIVSTNGGKHFDDGQNDVKMISRKKQSF